MHRSHDVEGSCDLGTKIKEYNFLVSASPPKLLDDAAKALHVHWPHDVVLYDLDFKVKGQIIYVFVNAIPHLNILSFWNTR